MRKPRVPTTVVERYEVVFTNQPDEDPDDYEDGEVRPPPEGVDLTVHWREDFGFDRVTTETLPYRHTMELIAPASQLVDILNALLDIGALQYDLERKRLYAGTGSTE